MVGNGSNFISSWHSMYVDLPTGNDSNNVHITVLLDSKSSADCSGDYTISLSSPVLAAEWLIEEANAGRLENVTVPGVTYSKCNISKWGDGRSNMQ